MNGVWNASVSAGSSHLEARVTCRPKRSSPSAARDGDGEITVGAAAARNSAKGRRTMSVVMSVTVGKRGEEIKSASLGTMPDVSRVRGRSRHDLNAIARRAMTELGLDPDYPPAAVAELDAIRGAPSDASV